MGNDRLVYKVDARDARVDFFRGLALYMILVDHVIDDPIAKFTYQHFGFSDAAEIFVFLSGVSCGIVYSRVLIRRGWHGLMTALSKRAGLIYCYYLLSSVAVLLLFGGVSGFLENVPVLDQSFMVDHEHPLSAIWSTAFLMSAPDLPGILTLYLVLTLVFIPLFLIGATRSAALPLAVSSFIWIISQFYPEPATRSTFHPYFNPLAWQFLFSIGMFLGFKYNNLDWSKLRSMQIFRWLVVGAWAILTVSFLCRFTCFLSWKFQLHFDWFCMSQITYHQMKRNLSAIRLLHFLSVVFLVTTYIKSSNPILKWPAAVAVRRVGMCSLEIFSMSVVLSALLNIINVYDQPPLLEKLILDAAIIILMTLTAVALTEFREKRRRALGPITLPP
jgi:hypothetical protein